MKRNNFLSVRLKSLKSFSGKNIALTILGCLFYVLLLTTFCFTSFLRPQAENNNKNMDTQTFTIVKTFRDYSSPKRTYTVKECNKISSDFYNENIAKLINKSACQSVNITFLYTVYNDNSFSEFCFMPIASGLNLFNFGYCPDESFKTGVPENLCYAIYPESDLYAEENMDAFISDYGFKTKRFNTTDFKTSAQNTIGFSPNTLADSPLLICHEEYVPTVEVHYFSVYYSISYKRKINDSELNFFFSQSEQNVGFVPSVYNYFIHPANSYLSFYGASQPIIETALFMDFILAAAIFVSNALTQYLRLRDRISELKMMKILGMSKSRFILDVTLSSSLSFAIPGIITALVFVLLMFVFSKIMGFTFWFSGIYWLVYLATIMVGIGLQAISSLLLYQKTKK
ncbi:MAG: hypothetical protein WCR67_03770 [Bacilli bacterium]